MATLGGSVWACGGSDHHPNAGKTSGGSGGTPSEAGSSSTVAGKASGGAGMGGVATGSGGGGAGGMAGAGGKREDVPPAKVVGDCSKLGPVDEFEDITPPGVLGQEYGVTNVVADPVNLGTVYAGTDKKGLFKTTDCGSTWTKVNTGTNGDIIDTGLLWSMVIDFIDPKVIYTSAAYGMDLSLMKSVDGGVNWKSTAPKGSLIEQTVQYNFLQDAAIDPTDHLHLVITFHGDCAGDIGKGCIAETYDGGESWKLLKGPTEGWVDGSGPQILGGQKFLIQTLQGGVFYTEDGGTTYEKVAPGADHSLYKAIDGTFYSGSDYGLLRSTDGAHHWDIVPDSPHGYGIIGDGKRMFLSLRYGEQPYFTSDETDGLKWTPMKSPTTCCGGVYMAYDPEHHVMYSANTRGGLWRVVTQ